MKPQVLFSCLALLVSSLKMSAPVRSAGAFTGVPMDANFLFSHLALLVSSLKLSAPVELAGAVAGVNMKAHFFLFSFSFACILFENVGPNKVGGLLRGYS